MTEELFVSIPLSTAKIIDGAFLPGNPDKLRSASPEVIEAAKQFKAMLSASPVPSTATQAGAVTEALDFANDAIERSEKELRLIRMKDSGVIYDTLLRSLIFGLWPEKLAKARAALASSPETARDRAERRVAELHAAGLRTLGASEGS